MKRVTFSSAKSGASLFTRFIAILLVPVQVVTCWPVQVLAADSPKKEPPPPTATLEKALPVPVRAMPKAVNRTVPSVARETPKLGFSETPTDAELGASRVFAEPLLPMGQGKSTAAENRALGDAILAFAQDPESTAPLRQFLATHPKSVWRVTLLTNLGIVQRRGAYWSEALVSWQEAWKLGKEEQEPTRRLIVDRALAELAELTARIGRHTDLETLLVEAGQRDVRGAATEKWATARESLHLMKTEPTKSFRCGPLAVGRIYAALNPRQAVPLDIHDSVSTDHGTSLDQVQAFAAKLGLKYQIAFRSPGAEVIVPSVVNWKVGHYAALTKQINDRYLVQDTTFTDDFVISRAALDQEASGYFLVPAGNLPKGWRTVDTAEGKKVWGKGGVTPGTPSTTPDTAPCVPCPLPPKPNPKMAGYNVDVARVNLILSDTPIWYAPPRGPEIAFSCYYSHREVAPSSVPSYPYLGPKWNFGWVSFVIDDTSNAVTKTYGPGGGTLEYTGYTSSGANSGSFAPQALNQTVLERTSATTYVRKFPSGAKQVYGLADNSSPKRIYLTEVHDPAGNQTIYTYDASTFRLAAVTDAIGQVTTLAYVSNDPNSTNGDYYRVKEVTDPFGRKGKLDYNASGQLAKITDTAGITSEFTYGTGDFITKLTTPYGDTTFVANDVGSDRSLLITDPEGAQEYIEFKYDKVAPDAGAAVPSAAGLLTNTSYQQYRNTYYWDKKAYAEAKGNYSKAHLRHWLHTTSGGSMADILESEKQALESRVYYNYAGQTNAYLASSSGNLVTKSARVLDDGSTQLFQYDYNSQGRITKSVSPGDVTTPARTTTYQYAANGLDVTTVYQQNPAGQSLDPFNVAADKLSSLTYDAGGLHLVESSTDAAGQTTNFTYNSFGQLLTVTNALNETTTLAYDRDDDSDTVSDGYLVSTTGPVAGAVTQFAYDGFGRLWQVTDADNDTVTVAYEAIGGDATKTLNRVVQTTYPDNTTEQVYYDRLDPQWTKDRLGRWTQLWHDKLRRLSAVVDPQNQVTQYQWCSCGSLEALIDPAGNQTTWIRDEQSRVVQKVYPDNTVVSHTYEDRTSRLKNVRDAKGQFARYQYFIDNSLKQVSWTDAAGAALVPPTPMVSYTYDAVYPRAATMTDGIGTTQYGYNSITVPAALGAGRVATIDGPWANDTISYEYDELGRVTERAINGAANTVNLGYDTLGRLNAVTNPLGAFGYAYEGVTGRLDHVDYPNGQKTQFAYFGTGDSRRLQQIKHIDASTAVISQFDYTYNAEGSIQTWTQNHSGLTNPRQYTFGYDGLDQLTAATLKNTVTSATLREQAYRYDAAGNRTTTQDGNQVVTETPNELNQFTQVAGGGMMRFAGTLSKPANVTVGGNPATVRSDNSFEGHAQVAPNANTRVHIVATDIDSNVTDKYVDITPDAVGAKAFTYDLNGNTETAGPTGAPNITYGWDAADRLVRITQGSNVTTFEYDGLGRRVREKLNGIETRRWVWCGLELCEERDASNNVTKRFYGQGEQIASAAYYATHDHLGSIRELTDTTGAIRARYDYDLYGQRSANLVTVNPVESDFGFTGHQEFATLGLVGAPYRFYQPTSARWLSRDPIGEAGGMNLYGYVYNSPVATIDADGLFGLGFVGGASGTLGGFWGIGGTASMGAGLFLDLDKRSGTLGGYESLAANAGPTHFGAAAALGTGVFVTNANCPEDLKKPSHNLVGNLDFGPGRMWGFTLSWGDGIFNLELYVPRGGPGKGTGLSYIPPPNTVPGSSTFAPPTRTWRLGK